mgnify:CR=1 FL=1
MAALGLGGAGEVDGEERLGEASPKGVVASGVGGGGARGNGSGSRRSSNSGEVCARLREAMAAPAGGKRGRGPRWLYLWRGGAARCVEEGQRRGGREESWSDSAVAARRARSGESRARGRAGRLAGPAGPWPGELGRPGPVGPGVFFKHFFNAKKQTKIIKPK